MLAAKNDFAFLLFMNDPTMEIMKKLAYTYGTVEWNPIKKSLKTIAAKGIIQVNLFLKWYPVNNAKPPIGAKLGAWGIMRAIAANTMIAARGTDFFNTFPISIRFYRLASIYNCPPRHRPFFRSRKKTKIPFLIYRLCDR